MESGSSLPSRNRRASRRMAGFSILRALRKCRVPSKSRPSLTVRLLNRPRLKSVARASARAGLISVTYGPLTGPGAEVPLSGYMIQVDRVIQLPRAKELTQKSFESLLARLDPDRNRAGEEYERTRQRLVRFFEWNDCADPACLADDTINRAARKIDEGETIKNLDAYFSGIARHVLQEHRRELKKQPEALNELLLARSADPPVPLIREAANEKEAVLQQCMEYCVHKLSGEERRLVAEYERGEKSARIRNRERLAKRLRISPNALRLHVFRIKQKLQTCFADCLKANGRE